MVFQVSGSPDVTGTSGMACLHLSDECNTLGVDMINVDMINVHVH